MSLKGTIKEKCVLCVCGLVMHSEYLKLVQKLGCSDYVYRQPNVTQTHEGVRYDMVYGLMCPICAA